MFLKIASVPSDGHTESNCVYMNQADITASGNAKFVDIRGYPYSILADERVAPGTLAMNGIQRKCCGVTTTMGDSVELPAGGIRPPAALIVSTVVELEHVAASKRGGTVDVKEFVEFFTKRFEGQYFRDGQSLAVIQENSPYKFLAKFTTTIIAASTASKNDEPIWGALGPETKLFVRPTDKSEITATNVPDAQVDSQQHQLVQKFDLENLGIGGLRAEFGQVFRRAFASRIFPQSFVKKLNVKHAKGVLLYGPPGTGKTLIARKIGEILNCRTPKIVNGPEVFNKFVGGTEENVRKLFAEAEAEQAAKGEQSQLHLIIFDEFDAICKQRGATRDGTGVNDNVVNQLLSKIDGVSSLNNVLLIGMTNRKDLIDEAILRPGRFEVHVEIGLPNEEGRVEIFRIHTKGIRENNVMAADVKLEELAKLTKNYSGAEIEGVVRSAISNTFNRHVDMEHPSETIQHSDVMVTHADFMLAIEEITPAFGQAKDECENVTRGGIIPYGPLWDVIDRKCNNFVDHLRAGSRIESLAVLIEGPVGCGKSAVAAHLAMRSDFPYVKFISNDNLVGYGETQKSNIIRKAFDDAYKSNFSVIVLDDLERLIEYSHLGGRYSNILLQTLLVLIKRPPPEGKKLMVVGTTSLYDVMESLELTGCFSVNLQIPTLDSDSLPLIVKGMKGMRFRTSADERLCVDAMPSRLGIKKLLLVIEMAAVGDDEKERTITFDSFNEAIMSTGLR
ncbi:vesicle-fusing ATPase, putative [Bodo saltans]|uniref:Vesicle-fusing ATPase n=1 Tax=Bodo saltans TaxID=75058 RepID=A0A0S4JTC3_BODSA|nr:vesicle-fusing ATPase, putative [Bodo saltans]|eukprot:CUG93603.1 vesicle-fusing ATPase, putative [Bodo saltans]